MKKLNQKLCLWFLCMFLFIHAIGQSLSNDEVKKVSLDSLLSKNEFKNRQWINVLDEPTINAGIYQLEKNKKDVQTYHAFDEVYYVLQGKAKLKAGDKIIDVQPGAVIYIRAETEHQFFDITDDIETIVIFSKAINKQDTTTAVADYSYPDIAGLANDNEDVWNAFLWRKTMLFGLYMLPKKIDGDSSQVHKIDEINIVTEGSGKFSVDDVDMPVQKGDIIFVQKGKNHFFHSLNGDMKILILFETKSIQKP